MLLCRSSMRRWQRLASDEEDKLQELQQLEQEVRQNQQGEEQEQRALEDQLEVGGKSDGQGANSRPLYQTEVHLRTFSKESSGFSRVRSENEVYADESDMAETRAIRPLRNVRTFILRGLCSPYECSLAMVVTVMAVLLPLGFLST